MTEANQASGPKTVVVSGGASGIGAATAERLRADGLHVITVDRQQADVVADLSSPAGREQAVAGVQELLAADGAGPLVGVVPAAGVAGLTGTDPELVVSVNYFGVIALVEGLREELVAGGGSVVLLSSNSTTCQPGWPREIARICLAGDEDAARAAAKPVEAVHIYPATKAAIAAWGRREGVKEEWAGAGVRINALAPGLIATPMTDQLREDPELGVFADAYPTALHRPGRAEEIAGLVAFLLSDAASLLVGSVLFADGGTDAMMYPEVLLNE